MMAGLSTDGSRPRPTISRSFLEANRRRRYFEATAEILHEFGRAGLSVATVVKVSGTSRSTFYETFGGVEDCLNHAVSVAEAELFAGLEDAGDDGVWIDEVHRAIAGFYGAVVARPLRAELFLIHAPAARSDAGRSSFWSGGERFAALLRRGRREAEARGRRPPPPLTEELLSRAIVSLAAQRVRRDDVAGLAAEVRPTTLFAGSFFLGL